MTVATRKPVAAKAARAARPAPLPDPYSREGVVGTLRARYSTRLHMTLIMGASIAVAVLVTRSLLHLGVGALWERYLPALLSAYAMFFVGVWAWLHLTPYGRFLRRAQPQPARGSGLDIPTDGPDFSMGDLPVGRAAEGLGRGGGSFDGGGASASWAADGPLLDGVGDGASNVLDGVGGDDGGILLVVALALAALALAILFGAAGLVIWQAPSILGEVVFELMLASSLVKGARAAAGGDWSRILFARTWKPFTAIAAAALGFAAFAAWATPAARTAGEVFRLLASR